MNRWGAGVSWVPRTYRAGYRATSRVLCSGEHGTEFPRSIPRVYGPAGAAPRSVARAFSSMNEPLHLLAELGLEDGQLGRSRAIPLPLLEVVLQPRCLEVVPAGGVRSVPGESQRSGVEVHVPREVEPLLPCIAIEVSSTKMGGSAAGETAAPLLMSPAIARLDAPRRAPRSGSLGPLTLESEVGRLTDSQSPLREVPA